MARDRDVRSISRLDRILLQIVNHYIEGWSCKDSEAEWLKGCVSAGERAFRKVDGFGNGKCAGLFLFDPNVVELHPGVRGRRPAGIRQFGFAIWDRLPDFGLVGRRRRLDETTAVLKFQSRRCFCICLHFRFEYKFILSDHNFNFWTAQYRVID